MNKYPELNILKGKIREKGETYRSMSEKTGIPLNTFSNKLNGYSLFDITEVISICSILDIPPEQIPYFFTKKCCVIATQQVKTNSAEGVKK